MSLTPPTTIVRGDARTSVMNALTIDYEDWYHGIEIPPDQWAGYEERIGLATDRLLAISTARSAEPPSSCSAGSRSGGRISCGG
jgi:hypothetical protein